MGVQFPIHPDDLAALLRLRRYLIGFRKTNGWSQPELSLKINGTKGMVWELESSQLWQWRLARLQGWVGAFGLRLHMKVVFPSARLTKSLHKDPEVEPFWLLSQGRDNWALWQKTYLSSALTVARRKLRISSRTMANRMNSTRGAIWNWEATADELMLPMVLHRARMLGGYVELWWVDDDAA